MKSKARIYKLGVILVIFLLAVGSCRKAGSWLVKTDEPGHADVMVMLMGSISERVLQTADLYSGQVSGKVWIVEEGMGAIRTLEERGVKLIPNSTQASNALTALGVPADSILILPGDASSSRMEAEMVRDYLLTLSDMDPQSHMDPQSGIDTLLLVSSAWHTRRAFKIFNAACKSLDEPPVVRCSPNPYTAFDPEKWWKSKNDIQSVVTEYLKLANFVFFERRELRRGK